MENCVVGLDVGTKKTAVLVAEVADNEAIEVIGAGCAESSGIERGVVVDPHKATHSIKKAVEEAEGVSGTKIQSVYAGISGQHIETFESYGTVSITSGDKRISQRDIKRVIKAARPKEMPPEKKVIQTDLKQYVVDGQVGITDPVGMVGSRLEVYQHVVTGSITAVLNLVRAIENARLAVDQIFLNSLASARAVLGRAEKKQGVVLMDIGGGITDLAVFKNGRPLFSTCLPIAGENVTKDLAIALAVPFEEAERIKIDADPSCQKEFKRGESIKSTTIGGENIEVSATRLSEIIAPRWEEIFELALSRIKEKGYWEDISLGIIITGGAIQVDGLTEYLQGKYEIPVRQGKTDARVQGLSDIVRSPGYATAIGLVICGLEATRRGWVKEEKSLSPNILKKAFDFLHRPFET